MTAEKSVTPAKCSVSSSRILIVDDNQETALALSKILESQRFKTVTAFRGLEALEYARANGCAAAMVDVHLPDLNGLVVVQKLRDLLGPDTPIIVVSGDTSMEVINALSHIGATYFFSKPLNVACMIDRMKEWLGEPEPDVQQSAELDGR